MRSTLNFNKFLDILTNHDIELEKVFSQNNEIIFFQTKYKSYEFFIYLPDNYRMLLKKDIPHINIDHFDELNLIAENFLNLLKTRLDSGLLVISNNHIFTSTNASYKMNGKIRIHHNEIGLIDLLEKKGMELAKDISIKFSETEPSEEEEIESEEKPVLEFLDYDGQIIKQDSNYADLITDEDFSEYSQEDMEENIIEWELKDYPLRIGKIFKLVAITDFFEDQGIAKIENDVELFFNEIYQTEQEMRKEKFDDISDMYINLKEKYEDAYDFFEKQEKKLLHDKGRLQSVISAMIFKKHVKGKTLEEVTEIVNKANGEIKNIDLKLLKIRDSYNEYFDKCFSHYKTELENFDMPTLSN